MTDNDDLPRQLRHWANVLRDGLYPQAVKCIEQAADKVERVTDEAAEVIQSYHTLCKRKDARIAELEGQLSEVAGEIKDMSSVDWHRACNARIAELEAGMEAAWSIATERLTRIAELEAALADAEEHRVKHLARIDNLFEAAEVIQSYHTLCKRKDARIAELEAALDAAAEGWR